jgi:hypothetical protein
MSGATQVESEMLDQYDANFKWFFKNLNALRKEYKDTYVAVSGRRVVGEGKDIDKLYQKLEASGIPLETAFIRFVSAENVLAIL